MEDVLKETKERMQKSVEAYEQNLGMVRTGRANPEILRRVSVDYYGAKTPLTQMATISSPDPRTLVITPFDKSVIGNIERAIQDSDLGFNPNNRGDNIFITVPALTDQRRKDLVKTTKGMAEEARVAVRNIRRDSNDMLKEMQKENMITEDDLRNGEQKVQKVTDDYISIIDVRLKDKETDIMAV